MLDYAMTVWMMASVAMSFALTKNFPDMKTWDNFSRSIAFPVTLWEMKTDRL